ncbi:MAG TPA: hypothetical protein VHA56_09000 [Mucilaginibacter sp.]|nr:hypothetical protein [Mucilaginibacter sp.]
MKKISISVIALLCSVCCFAQQQLAFPFSGGKEKMEKFFKDSIAVSQDIIKKKVTGTVIFKFTADEKGNISKTIVYYADDVLLVEPVIAAIRQSNGQWVIPEHEKTHDFVMPFYIRYNIPDNDDDDLAKAALANYRSKRPVYANNQVPLDMVTLLPAITISYDVTP